MLSDGEYTEILVTKINPEFPVHTFGLGIGHNPKVLKSIADMTSGTYSFLKEKSNMKDALALFIVGLHLTPVAMSPVKITLRAHFGITISAIEYSGPCTHKVESDQMSGTISIDRIYAGERKEIIVNLTVGHGRKKLMTIGGQYKNLNESKSLAEVEMSVLRPWCTSSPGELAINFDVAAVVARIRLQNGVLAMIEKQQLTCQNLQKLWDEIKDSDKDRGMLEETLSGLSIDVAEMKRHFRVGLYVVMVVVADVAACNQHRATIRWRDQLGEARNIHKKQCDSW